ncbi:uncharacterized protein LOC141726826 [Zonotrichia albicollis]|uniref:uncharacterized protein LOC141726826 n=1 Tax=Zonotrichia albicollis TaxID=44394 RepID=UPI003D80D517
MELRKSKFQKKPQEKPHQDPGTVLPEIPRESPLGWMLEHWDDSPRRVGKSKEKMIQFCMEKWGGGKEIAKYVVWPVFSTFEMRTCESLYDHVVDHRPQDFEEIEYAEMWKYSCSGLYPIRALRRSANRGKEWEPLDNLAPPYLVPPPQPTPAQVPLVPALPPEASILQGQASASPLPLELTTVPSLPRGQATAPLLPCKQPQPPTLPKTEEKQVFFPKKASSPLAYQTRQRMRRATTGDIDDEEEKPGLSPLQEVPTAPGIIGFVHAPIDTGDVRAFKKEMGKLMDDPLGVAERLDKFLGTSTYTYEDLNAILRSLFNNEEREMIRQATIRDWENRNPQGEWGDQRWPNQKLSWSAQTEEGRQKMINLRNVIIQGIGEVVPKGQNMSKVLRECRGKNEPPTEWMERLRKSLRMYSRTDPDSPIGVVLLKTQFMAKSWIKRYFRKIRGVRGFSVWGPKHLGSP